MNDARGTAVISDFDGTLARLAIPWAELRATLSVDRIEDLWRDPDRSRWDTVTRAEVEAAILASPVPEVMDALVAAPAFAVLTNNDESAVETFLERWPVLRARVCTVVGRRALAGPKTDFDVFSSGYAACVEALAAAGGTTMVTYIGDMRYELDYARRLGAHAVDAKELAAVSRRPGEE